MHDPNTVAFNVPFITIWHVDPESDGTDDSCGWVFPHLTEDELELAKAMAGGDEFDNLRHWFPGDDQEYDVVRKIARIFRCYKAHVRPWYKHPRWHFWHWEFQIHPVQKLKRWLFSRDESSLGA